MADPPPSTAAIVTPKPTSLALAALAAPPRPARTLYFAYGSDMQISYMARTCPNSRYIGRAVLTDYKWHINGLGFANLIKVKMAHAPGLVFEVDDTDKASLEGKRFPLYESVTVDAELYPAPFCLYRRQATWITKHGGPEAVLEEAYASGRGNDRRASYTERGILVFISGVTVDGRPDARYAEAINAAAADAMALGIEPLFFEKIVQHFMPGRMLPYLRVVRRGRTGGSGPIGSARTGPVPLTSASLAPTTTTTTDEKPTTTASATTTTTTTTEKPRGSTDSLRPGRAIGITVERDRSRSAEKEKEKEKEKETSPTTSKDSGKEKATSGLSETIRSMFNRQRGRRKESNESAESSSAAAREAAGGRRSPLLTGSESGNASSDDNANSPSTDKIRKPAVPARPPRFDDDIYRPENAQAAWAKRILSGNSSGPIRGSDIVVAGGSSSSNRHSKSQSESSLVDTRPPAPKITISGPSRHNTMERDGPSRKYGTDGDNDSDSEVEKPSALKTATTATTTSGRRPSGTRARQFVVSPPPRPANPAPERAAGSSNVSALSGGYTPIYASQTKNRSADSVLPAVTVGTGRKDTSGWDKELGGSSSSSTAAASTSSTSGATSGTTSSRLKAAKPPGKKRPSTDEVLRARAAAYRAFTADMAVNNKSSPVEAAAFIAAAERARNEFAADVDIKELTERTRQIAQSIVDKETAKDKEKAKEKAKEEEDDDEEESDDEKNDDRPPPPPREAPPTIPAEKPKPVEVETESEDEDEDSTEEAESSPEPESVPVPAPAPAAEKPTPPTRVPTVPKPVQNPAPAPIPTPTPTPAVRLPYAPRRPLRFHNAQKAAAATEKERMLRRPKSFCTSSRSVSRFDRFLLQAAEHPHFAAKAWLPAFRGRHQYHLHGQHSHFQSHHYGHAHGHGHGHGHHFFGHSHAQIHAAPRRMVFTQTTIVSSMPRERRMSF